MIRRWSSTRPGSLRYHYQPFSIYFNTKTLVLIYPLSVSTGLGGAVVYPGSTLARWAEFWEAQLGRRSPAQLWSGKILVFRILWPFSFNNIDIKIIQSGVPARYFISYKRCRYFLVDCTKLTTIENIFRAILILYHQKKETIHDYYHFSCQMFLFLTHLI